MNNLYEILENTASQHSDKRAVGFKEHNLTYQDLKEASDRLASGLKRMGLGCGDRIALMLPNVPHFVISYFALLKVGVTVIPISIQCKTAEIHHQLEDAEVRGIIYWEGSRGHVHEAVTDLDHCEKLIVLGTQIQAGESSLIQMMEINKPLEMTEHVDPEETALIIYTAGITGRSKGAEFTHHAILSNIESCKDFLNLTDKDSVLAGLPLSLPVGLTLIIGTFVYTGGCIYLTPKTDAENILLNTSQYKPTYCIGAPSMYNELALIEFEERPDISSVVYWLSTGDAMKQETMDAFENKFNAIILEGYGLTEAGPMVSFNDPSRERKAGSIGLPLHGIDMKIVDQSGHEVMTGQIGEILVHGPNLMKGYLNKPEATKSALEDGWLHTGDLARLDETGFPIFVVRKKNVIMKSGFSVYPREVEKLLSGFPKILESVIIGLPDPSTGEEIHAGVVLKKGETGSQDEIISYCREMVAAYKAPKTVTFFDQLPKGPGGRVLRDEFKTILSEKLNNQNS